MIDCHSHFYWPQFTEGQLQELAEGALAVGVKAIVVVPECLQDCKQVLQLSTQQPLVQPCAGLHPVQPLHGPEPQQYYSGCRSVQEVAEVAPVLDFIRAHADRLVAIGEVGLDFSPHVLQPRQPDNALQQCAAGAAATAGSGQPPAGTLTADDLKDVQRVVFQQQIQLANELGLPINVHSRSAGHHAVKLLNESNAHSALLHAFDGKPTYALQGAQAGYFFSVPPSIVRSPQKQKLVATLPLDNLVLETDAPALGPDKEDINVPANIAISAREIARIKGVPVEQVVQVTTGNALKLFTRLKVMP